jgi:hypothetical protein
MPVRMVNMERCPICGIDHEQVAFDAVANPGSRGIVAIGTCPTLGHAIYLREDENRHFTPIKPSDLNAPPLADEPAAPDNPPSETPSLKGQRRRTPRSE